MRASTAAAPPQARRAAGCIASLGPSNCRCRSPASTSRRTSSATSSPLMCRRRLRPLVRAVAVAANLRRRRRARRTVARVEVGSTKMRSRSPGGSVNSSAPSSTGSGSIGTPAHRHARGGHGLGVWICRRRRVCGRRGFALGAGARGGAAAAAGGGTVLRGGAARRGGAVLTCRRGGLVRRRLNLSMSCRRANSTSVASKSSLSARVRGGAGRVGAGECRISSARASISSADSRRPSPGAEKRSHPPRDARAH